MNPEIQRTALRPHEALVSIYFINFQTVNPGRTNAIELARQLEANPLVRKVYYRGLENHPGHNIAIKRMKNIGGIED